MEVGWIVDVEEVILKLVIAAVRSGAAGEPLHDVEVVVTVGKLDVNELHQSAERYVEVKDGLFVIATGEEKVLLKISVQIGKRYRLGRDDDVEHSDHIGETV